VNKIFDYYMGDQGSVPRKHKFCCKCVCLHAAWFVCDGCLRYLNVQVLEHKAECLSLKGVE
jgi:ribosomal protein S27AE